MLRVEPSASGQPREPSPTRHCEQLAPLLDSISILALAGSPWDQIVGAEAARGR
jgi:hypothetical protein